MGLYYPSAYYVLTLVLKHTYSFTVFSITQGGVPFHTLAQALACISVLNCYTNSLLSPGPVSSLWQWFCSLQKVLKMSVSDLASGQVCQALYHLPLPLLSLGW